MTRGAVGYNNNNNNYADMRQPACSFYPFASSLKTKTMSVQFSDVTLS